MTSSVASRPGFLRWLVTAGDPATLVATFSTAAGSPVNLSGSTVAAACANWSTSHAGSATVGGASNNEVTVAFTDTITGQLTGGGWTWTLTVDGVTTLAGPLDVAQPGVAGVTGGDASAVVVVDDVNVAVTVVGGGGGGAVDSVNGQTGVVVLDAGDVGADPAGTAAGLVDDLSGVTNAATARTNLGLGNVDNTSDANKPVSTAQQTALDGKAAASHSHAGTDITSGTVGTARLGSGSASSSTYLRGDQTWAAVTPGASAINDLTDVDTTTDPPDADDVLAWDGVMWTPATLQALGAPDLSNATPADLGVAAPGVASEASRADHVHDMPSAADVGAAASLHVHSGVDITSGTVGTARLGSGTANATTFLRGDQTWAAAGGGGGVTEVRMTTTSFHSLDGPASNPRPVGITTSQTRGRSILSPFTATGTTQVFGGVPWLPWSTVDIWIDFLNNNASAGDVKWQVAFGGQAGAHTQLTLYAATVAVTAASGNEITYGQRYTQKIASAVAVATTDMLDCQVVRLGDDAADTLAGSVWLKQLRFREAGT